MPADSAVLARPRPRPTGAPAPSLDCAQLLGLPAAVLEDLTALRVQARARILDLHEWRAQHAAVLARVPAVPTPARLGAARELVLETALAAEDRAWELGVGGEAADTDADAGSARPDLADLGALTSVAEARAYAERAWALHDQLDVLEGPPTDAAVRTVLPTCDRDRREALRNHDPRVRDGLAARLDERERLHRAWLHDVEHRAEAGPHAS